MVSKASSGGHNHEVKAVKLCHLLGETEYTHVPCKFAEAISGIRMTSIGWCRYDHKVGHWIGLEFVLLLSVSLLSDN